MLKVRLDMRVMPDCVLVLDSDERQMIKKCGSTKPDKIVSSSNSLKVKFHSDSSVVKKGFRATWKQVTASSGGNIKTPNYPNPYPTNQDKVSKALHITITITVTTALHCQTWTLEVPSGQKVELTFESFELELHSSCGYDYVQVSFGSTKQKYCGSTKPGPITSSGKKMTVLFHSDYSENYKGFSAVWKAVA